MTFEDSFYEDGSAKCKQRQAKRRAGVRSIRVPVVWYKEIFHNQVFGLCDASFRGVCAGYSPTTVSSILSSSRATQTTTRTSLGEPRLWWSNAMSAKTHAGHPSVSSRSTKTTVHKTCSSTKLRQTCTRVKLQSKKKQTWLKATHLNICEKLYLQTITVRLVECCPESGEQLFFSVVMQTRFCSETWRTWSNKSSCTETGSCFISHLIFNKTAEHAVIISLSLQTTDVEVCLHCRDLCSLNIISPSVPLHLTNLMCQLYEGTY